MDVDIGGLRNDILGRVGSVVDLAALEELRVAALGKRGSVTELVKQLGGMPAEQRREAGQAFNTLKREVEEALATRRGVLQEAALAAQLEAERIDITLPARERQEGRIHPVSQAAEEIVAIFADMGFSVAEGPDVEDDWHNFEALNIPPEHPARQMFDTFYLEAERDGRPLLLRTHTSPVQIRTMQAGKPPFRIIAPGRTYRRDSDATHTPMFHQVEGLLIDRRTHMGHLKGCLIDFVRPISSATTCRCASGPATSRSPSLRRRSTSAVAARATSWWSARAATGWRSWAAAWSTRSVLQAVGLDPEEWQGFAFGMGIDRVAMLKYGIPDLRTFFEADLRWLRHYGFVPLDIPTTYGGLSR